MLWNLDQRMRAQETFGDERWIYVGSPGVDGVDDLLTPDSPPFQNGWTNSFGSDPPVSFRRTLNAWAHIRGGYAGGGSNTVVFILPPGFRPEFRQRFTCGTASPAHYATYYVEPTGEVVFGQVV
jgi:hypothetical protein